MEISLKTSIFGYVKEFMKETGNIKDFFKQFYDFLSAK